MIVEKLLKVFTTLSKTLDTENIVENFRNKINKVEKPLKYGGGRELFLNFFVRWGFQSF